MKSRLKSVPLFALTTAVLLLPLTSCQQTIGSNGDVLTQGWSVTDREHWYEATQGSRLMPYAWFVALEQPGSQATFADPAYLESFGYLSSRSDRPDTLPVGFAIDRQGDDDFKVTKLHWYEGQTGRSKDDAEPWVGLNCSACHTGEVSYQGKAVRVDGGPGLGDLDKMTAALNTAMIETRDQPAKWERFATKVLKARDTPANRALLKTKLSDLIAWQLAADRLNATNVTAGFARVDAFGHIYNKVVQFSGADDPIINTPDAPVSYPFLWDISRHHQVQWNGVAVNSKLSLGGTKSLEYGALGRNAGEVIGVFGEVVIKPASGFGGTFKGYRSTLNAPNLDRLETMLTRLEPPAWPASFPQIDEPLRARGEILFKQDCASCHKPKETWEAGKPIEVMVPLKTLGPDNLTDVWMACNAFTYQARSGLLTGTKSGFVSGDPLKPTEKVVTLLATSVKGALVGKKGDIIKSAAGTFLGINRPPVVFTGGEEDALTKAEQREQRRDFCKTTADPLLAYKARPLDGIWATAPYLHNGSVPTLYHLLLPAKDRPKRFWLGSREYDPKAVGYVWAAKPEGRAFDYVAVGANGKAVDGNSNAGHEYGAAGFSESDRWALVEYMKSI